MTTLLAKVFFLAVLIAFSVSFGSSEASSAEPPPLVFLGHKDYPPVAYVEDGEVKGMDVDLAKALSQPMKREVRVELMDWNLAQEKVLNGEADGLLGLSISDERRKLYNFAKPTFTREFGFVVRTGETVIRGGKDLSGKKVGVTAGGFPRKFMEALPGIQLVLIDNYTDGFDRLINGTIDVFAADLWVAAYLIERDGTRGVSIVGKPFATTPGAIAVKKGNLTLLNQINRAIETLEADGTITKIEHDWRPHEMVFASRQKIRGAVTLAAGLILVILCGVMAMWIITLRNQIRVRERAELALKESEERFQLAVRGSNDGLWDWDVRTDEVYYTARFRELLGYESPEDFPPRLETFYSHLHRDDSERTRNAVEEHLNRRTPYDIEYRLRTRAGEYRWFRARGQAIWNEQGEAIRMAGSIKDITERKQTIDQINLLLTITMDVATAEDLPAALKVVLRRVCEKTGWALGQAWTPNENGSALDCGPAWFAPEGSQENFRGLSRNVTFLPGVGLPGRVWKSRQPAWVRDVTQDANFPRSQAAMLSGLKAGMAVPILCGEEVIAVLEFFFKEPRAEDERLVDVISNVAAQIGLVVERKRAEQALRKSEELVRAVVEDQSEMIVRWKPDGTRTFVNESYCRHFGYTREEVIGKSFFPLLNDIDRNALLLKICALTPVQPVGTDLRKSISASSEIYWHEWTDRGIFDADGRMLEIQSTGRDITKRKRAAELIKTQKHALEMIASGKPMKETLDDLLRMLEAQSPSMFCSILLLDPDGVHVRHCAAPSLPEEYIKAIDGSAIGPCAGSCGTAAFRHEPVFVADIENDPLWKDYKRFALPHGLRACWSTPIFDAQQKVLGTFAIYYLHTGLPDESHQKLIDVATDTAAVCIAKHRADEALRESEKQFRAVVEFSPECIAVSVEDRLVYVNPAGAKMVGANDPAQLIGRSVYDFGPPELHELARERRRSVMQSGTASPPIAAPLIRLDGTTFYAETISAPFVYRGQPAILNLIRDISERKRAEEALRKSEELFRAVVEDQSEMIVRWKPDGTRTFVNAAYCRTFGGTFEQYIGTSFFPLISELDREAVLARIRTLTPAHPVSTAVHRSVSPGGGLLWQEWTDRAIFDAHGQLVELQSVGRDITERKRAEEALRASEESLRATIENTPGVAVQWYDDQGRVLFWNSASETIYGWKAAEALGKTLDQLIYTPEEAANFLVFLQEVERSGRSIGPSESLFHRRDGSTGFCLSTIFQISVAAGQSRFVCMDVDVTERKAAEESMRQGQERELRAREEFAQQLIASQEAERRRIAGELHDSLGQNLSIIKNRAQLALSEKSTPADSRPQLEAINDLVSQAIIEVRQISRDLHPYQIHHLGLTGAIKAMIETTADASEIKFQSKLDRVDECFSEESAVNLYRIVQESLNNILKHSGAKQTRIELERDVHEIQLRIEDDGCGFNMSAEKNGLGLKNMAERVRILRGELKVVSQPKQGTRIEVTIPIVEDKCL